MTAVRIIDRILAGVVALSLLVGGVVVAVEVALQGIGRDGPWVLPWDTWYDEGIDTTWSDPVVRAVCIGLVAVALLLLVLQLARRKPAAVELEGRREGLHVDLDRRGLEQWLGARLARVDGVASADVRSRRRKVKVRAEAISRDTDGVERQLGEAADDEVERLRLAKRPKVKVDVASRRKT